MTGGYTVKEKNIRELAKRMGLITVENMCQYTIAQLVYMVANKVNELVDEVWRFETDVQETLKTQNENIQYLLGEGLHLEVGNIFDGWIQDGTFDTLINQTALKKVNKRIDETNTQLTQKASEVDLAVERLRIDQLTKLEAGSTTGDAELIDGRIGTDGITYDSVGSAIRGQIGKIVDFDNSKNLFDKRNVKINTFISYNGDNTIKYVTNNDFSTILIKVSDTKQYTVTALSFSCFAFDGNLKRIDNVKIISGSSEEKVTLTIPSGTKYISISYRHAYYPTDQFMVVEGTSLPSTYIPFYERVYLKDDVIIKKNNTNNGSTEVVYHIGTGKDFNTLTDAIRELKNDESEKVFLIEPGTYDMFEEMGGKTYFDSLDTTKKWQELNDIVPPNTKIIGVGRVTLKFTPSTSELKDSLVGLISPLNFIYDAHLENVTVIANNCRYAIHDESGGYESGIGKKHFYKNVILEKGHLGNVCAFGCGFIGNNNFEFDGCIFKCVDRPLSMHNSGHLGVNDNTDILIKNSAFITSNNTQNRAVNLRNVNPSQAHITVQVINSYLDAPLTIQNETETERPNAFDVIVIGGTVDRIDVKNTTNVYPPKKY